MFQRFFDEGLAQSSYLVACERTREAAVVDPRRDISVYLDAARQRSLTIRYAIETHVHADFVSGAHELLAAGARAITGPGAGLAFDHHEVHDGERLAMGDVTLTFMHTPGHTPEHISILLEQPDQPIRLLSGDTLFVGAVGRPDLLGDQQARGLAGELYDSLYGKLLALDDDIEVHPGHGAGSLCGAGIGREPHSTIGRERAFNPMLAHPSRDSFIAAVLADLPETPGYFKRMKRVNKEGPPLLGVAGADQEVTAIAPANAAAAMSAGAVAIDLRGADAFCASHPRGALNIGYGPKVGYWAGWVVPADARIVLLAVSERDAADATRQLRAVGLDGIVGFIEGGAEAWHAAGLPMSQIPQITVAALRDRLARRDRLAVLDVRTPGEWRSGHLPAATHVPVGDVAASATGLPRNAPVATICEGGYRSALAASLLTRAGLSNVVNVSGGMAAYRAMESGS